MLFRIKHNQRDIKLIYCRDVQEEVALLKLPKKMVILPRFLVVDA